MRFGSRRSSVASSTRLAPVDLATLSLGAAAIHFGVVPQHFAEFSLFGAFFSLIGRFHRHQP